MADEGSGVLYIATTEKRFVDKAIRSALSVKRVMDLPITLVTDLEADGPFDRVRRIEPPDDPFRAKIEAICDTPYDRTLYLDSDTYVVRDSRELLGLLERFDIAVAHDTHRVAVPVDGLPESYPEFNTGVLAYRRSAMTEIGAKWLALYSRYNEPSHAACDQPWFRKAVYESGLSIATVPPEWNTRFLLAGFYNLPVAILHGHATAEQFEKAARVMTDVDPEFWSQYVHYDLQVWGPHGSARKLLDMRHPLHKHRAYRGLIRLLRTGSRGRRTPRGRGAAEKQV